MRPVLLACLLLISTVSAQGQETGSEPDTATIRVTTRYVLLDALVRNKKTGNLVGTLDAEDFRLEEDGVPQKITYFSRDQLPLSVVFLFDLTDTVRPVLKPLAAGASEILGHLKPQDEVAVMVFSSHTDLLQDFTSDRALAAAAIDKAAAMKSEDGTFINEDMYEAVDRAMQSTLPDGRRVLVWLTDGTSNRENSSTLRTIGKGAPTRLRTKEESVEHLQRSGAVVAALIERFGATDAMVATSYINPFSLLRVRTGAIKRYANLTGGPVLTADKQNVPARLAALLDEIRGRYTLGYKPTTPKPDGTFCSLELDLSPNIRATHPDFHKGEWIVQTKAGYYR
jgi:VWFA-related protein